MQSEEFDEEEEDNVCPTHPKLSVTATSSFPSSHRPFRLECCPPRSACSRNEHAHAKLQNKQPGGSHKTTHLLCPIQDEQRHGTH